MGQNSQEVAYGFGQLGSMFVDTNTTITPPVGKCIVAISMITDVEFDADPAGLVPQTKENIDGTVTGDEYGKDITTTQGLEYFGTTAAHNLTAGNETAISGAGGVAVDDSNTFPKGLTIYGRWISVTPKTGTIVAYLGE